MTEGIDRRVLFYGDSFVAGAGDPTGLGWAGRLAATAAEAGTPITAYNFGVRHETSVEVARRGGAAGGDPGCRISPRPLGRRQRRGAYGDRRPREHETSVERFAAILEEAAALGLAPLAVGPPPAGEADGVHPAANGYAELAGLVLAAGWIDWLRGAGT